MASIKLKKAIVEGYLRYRLSRVKSEKSHYWIKKVVGEFSNRNKGDTHGIPVQASQQPEKLSSDHHQIGGVTYVKPFAVCWFEELIRLP